MSLGDLQHDFAADRVEAWDVFDGDFFGFAFALLFRLVVADNFDRVVFSCRQDVPVVKKGVFVFTDIDESSLEAGLQVLDAAFEDRADFAGFTRAFDFEFFEYAVLQQCHAFFERLRIDD